MNPARALTISNDTAPLAPASATAAESFTEFSLCVADLRHAFSLVSHATGSAFAARSHIDLDWSPAQKPSDVATWGLTATDGHRLARFTSERFAWFCEPDVFLVPLPGWIGGWIKTASDTAQITIRMNAERSEIVLPDYGTFRHQSGAFGVWRHLLAELRRRNDRGDGSRGLLRSTAASAIKAIEAGKREYEGAPIFLEALPDEWWRATFDRPANAIGLEPSYLLDALRALVRAAKTERDPMINARWAGKFDAVAFTVAHLTTIVMPRR